MPATVTDRLFGETTSVAVKAPVRAVATTNLTLLGLQTVGGTALAEGDRVAIAGQSNLIENGLYNASVLAWKRTGDFDGNRDVVNGTLVVLPLSAANGALYQVVGTDPIIPGTSPISFSLMNAPAITYPITQAEISALVTPINQGYPELDMRRYLLSIATSIYSAVQMACAVAAAKPNGGEIYIAAGAWQVTSAELATPWSVRANTTFIGDGEENTSITITGTTVTPCMFSSLNVGGISFKGLSFIGNSQANSSGTGFFWHAAMDTSAAAVCRKFRVQDCSFSNFKGDYWLYFDNQSNTYQMRDFRVTRNNFYSQAGNARDGTNIGVPSACIAFRGSFGSANGYLADAYVDGNTADCTYIKSFCISWHGSYNHKISGNTVLSAGASGISDDVGAYAFLAYDNAHVGSAPDRIDWVRNTVLSPRSCGFYCASGNRIRAINNYIAGQTDTNDGSIPKGAIAINQATRFTARGNDIEGCQFGISLVMPAGGIYKIHGNEILAISANGYGIKATTVAGAVAKLLDIDGITIDGTAAATTGIQINAGATYGWTKLNVRNFNISATSVCLAFSTSDATTPKIQYIHIANGEMDGAANYFLNYRSMSDATTRALIENLKFNGNAGGTAVTMASFASSLGLTVKNLEFCDYPSGTGFAIETTGARGALEGIRFTNVAAARRYVTSGSEELGVDVPTWTGTGNHFVQDLNRTELGSAASKYSRDGWIWDVTNAAWKECRTLTGN